MNDFKSYYPTSVEQCGCGAAITLAASDLVLSKLLAEWRDGHRHEWDDEDTDEAVADE